VAGGKVDQILGNVDADHPTCYTKSRKP
jgi:hypothetical protein